MFRTGFLSIIRSLVLYTQQAVSITCMTYTCCCVYSTRLLMWTETCPKHVEFYSKNKFEKLVHLVGFIIRILNIVYIRHFLQCCQRHFFDALKLSLHVFAFSLPPSITSSSQTSSLFVSPNFLSWRINHSEVWLNCDWWYRWSINLENKIR
jgi:hypothetical protein